MSLSVSDGKTLLFYINSLGYGGAERAILQLSYQFAIHGYRAILVTSFVSENEYAVPKEVERISIEQEQIIQSRLKRNVSRIRALRAICKNYKPVALISFMAEPNFRAIMATSGLKVKTIISVRTDPKVEYAGRLGRFISRHVLPKADGCVFQTEDAKTYFKKKLQKKSKVIFNEVGETFFSVQYEGGDNIVTLGRLNEAKNHRFLINAFSKIADKFPDVKLDIYGVGELEEKLTHQIADLQLQDRVRLMGRTTEAEKVLSVAKSFVLSSDYEGMPNALMEALAVGVPCISTDCPCGGPRALIENNANGILVPVGNEEELIIAMTKILEDKTFANALGSSAKQTAEKFKPDVVFAEWEKFVLGIIKK